MENGSQIAWGLLCGISLAIMSEGCVFADGQYHYLVSGHLVDDAGRPVVADALWASSWEWTPEEIEEMCSALMRCQGSELTLKRACNYDGRFSTALVGESFGSTRFLGVEIENSARRGGPKPLSRLVIFLRVDGRWRAIAVHVMPDQQQSTERNCRLIDLGELRVGGRGTEKAPPKPEGRCPSFFQSFRAGVNCWPAYWLAWKPAPWERDGALP